MKDVDGLLGGFIGPLFMRITEVRSVRHRMVLRGITFVPKLHIALGVMMRHKSVKRGDVLHLSAPERFHRTCNGARQSQLA